MPSAAMACRRVRSFLLLGTRASLCRISLDDLTHEDKARGWRPDWRVVALSFAFVLGFATVFVALGASASALGKTITAYFDTLAIIAGVIIIILGLHFLGLFRIGLLFREARFQTVSKPAGFLGAYVVGLAFAFGWFSMLMGVIFIGLSFRLKKLKA